MALPILTPDDFVGEVKISHNEFSEKELKLYISRYEKEILEELLGCEMAQELIDDLDPNNEPQDPKFIAIWEEFCKDEEPDLSFIHYYGYQYLYNRSYTNGGCKVQWKSRGIRELLKSQIYFLFIRDQPVKNTVTGNVKNQFSASQAARNASSNMRRIYNASLDWYWAIQWYVCKNPDEFDYENYNGLRKKPISLL